MTKTTILVCRDPRGSNWQLGPLSSTHGSEALIGWRQIPDPVDDGVPTDVAMVMARAFTAVARVTFLCAPEINGVKDGWTQSGEEFVRAMRKPGLARVISRVIDRIPRDAALVSTRRPETALRLFDDPAFPWWMQGQIVLLSAHEAGPPELDCECAISLVDNDDWSNQKEILSEAGILGMVRPGVDGDVAGLFSLVPSLEAALLSTLENETSRAGFEWAVLPEDKFCEFLAHSPSP
ncbi:hypothetical protein SAMN05216386_2056 [Nitrosospira briensis]|uniref:Uncharacterized protein n=1 Tax=Nitrosospira briensis TaxID=35799 RepID=A0A1I5CLI3_9PROT|nr:hypothetical protein [Nitrosospira briensis]SFN87885.1 hypothetical protein SAMN05216386_2056 [Nitrosospira briensis]